MKQCGIILLFIITQLVVISSITTPITFAWSYGVSMTPSYNEYDSVEMPTGGMYWTTPLSNIMVFFWAGSFTTDGVFVQNGYVYNGYSSYH
jgi:hypothetical protein